ncbi:MAG: DUF5110 domain-containing protein, partial [Sphingomonas sp.]
AFTLGKSLLIAPPPKPESPQTYDVCLPAGGWYDYWTGQHVGTPESAAAGPIQSATQAVPTARTLGDRVTETPRLDRLPVFVRAGTILPRQPLVQSTSETPNGPLRLDVYPGADCTGTLYEDDGRTLAYTRRGYFRQTVRCTMTPTGLSIDFAKPEGGFKPWWTSVAVTVHNWIGTGGATVKGKRVATTQDSASGTTSVTVPAQTGASAVVLTGSQAKTG